MSFNFSLKKLLYLRQYNIIALSSTIFFITFLSSIFSSIGFAAEDINTLNSELVDEEVIIESDRQSSDNKGGIFSAYGNVKIIYKKNGVIATSQQAQYLKKENILVLKGDVDLIRKGRDSLHAQRLVYLLENDEIIADSDSESQVLLNFFLDSGNTNQQPSSL